MANWQISQRHQARRLKYLNPPTKEARPGHWRWSRFYKNGLTGILTGFLRPKMYSDIMLPIVENICLFYDLNDWISVFAHFNSELGVRGDRQAASVENNWMWKLNLMFPSHQTDAISPAQDPNLVWDWETSWMCPEPFVVINASKITIENTRQCRTLEIIFRFSVYWRSTK